MTFLELLDLCVTAWRDDDEEEHTPSSQGNCFV